MSRGWFSDIDEQVEPGDEYVWQPCLETGTGHIPCLDVWFKSKADCDEWITEHILDVGLLPDPACG